MLEANTAKPDTQTSPPQALAPMPPSPAPQEGDPDASTIVTDTEWPKLQRPEWLRGVDIDYAGNIIYPESREIDPLQRNSPKAKDKSNLYRIVLEKRRTEAIELWLKGCSTTQIVNQLNISSAILGRILASYRETLHQQQKDSLERLAAERVEAFRNIIYHCWQYAEEEPLLAHRLLPLITRCEENIGKIQGVLSDKHLHLAKVSHEIKRYDFNGTHFPEDVVSTIENPNRGVDNLEREFRAIDEAITVGHAGW